MTDKAAGSCSYTRDSAERQGQDVLVSKAQCEQWPTVLMMALSCKLCDSHHATVVKSKKTAFFELIETIINAMFSDELRNHSQLTRTHQTKP